MGKSTPRSFRRRRSPNNSPSSCARNRVLSPWRTPATRLTKLASTPNLLATVSRTCLIVELDRTSILRDGFGHCPSFTIAGSSSTSTYSAVGVPAGEECFALIPSPVRAATSWCKFLEVAEPPLHEDPTSRLELTTLSPPLAPLLAPKGVRLIFLLTVSAPHSSRGALRTCSSRSCFLLGEPVGDVSSASDTCFWALRCGAVCPTGRSGEAIANKRFALPARLQGLSFLESDSLALWLGLERRVAQAASTPSPEAAKTGCDFIGETHPPAPRALLDDTAGLMPMPPFEVAHAGDA
mmetsp:Transcript_12437/g.34265  ORF Transcript_12437/g.34265 Transcript_12437/m.34265 type:complete len:295 (+) Transcript_12437:1490-2374(+)